MSSPAGSARAPIRSPDATSQLTAFTLGAPDIWSVIQNYVIGLISGTGGYLGNFGDTPQRIIKKQRLS
jgi:hypothetical protein